jgi:protein-S-isoprenylcysteine O-methyltransferase Ste14
MLQVPIVLALPIFLPAGTMAYANGWYVWANLTAWSAALTCYLLKYDPDLLERRLTGPNAEPETEQKRLQLFAGICVLAIFLVSSLDYRFGWSAVPVPAILAGHALICVGMGVVLLVFRENSFAASTIRIAEGQQVISTGPYAWVRHPMYSGAVLLFTGVPIALGSWWGLVMLAPLVVILAARLRREELFLVRHLPGYEAYRQKLRYRLMPGIW